VAASCEIRRPCFSKPYEPRTSQSRSAKVFYPSLTGEANSRCLQSCSQGHELWMGHRSFLRRLIVTSFVLIAIELGNYGAVLSLLVIVEAVEKGK
jgi:hypothetical protein